jgi:monoamine oxidase
MAPGTLTGLGKACLRQNVNHLYFAATEYADRWGGTFENKSLKSLLYRHLTIIHLGYMDGAIRSGQATADSVTVALNTSQ